MELNEDMKNVSLNQTHKIIIYTCEQGWARPIINSQYTVLEHS